MKVFDYGTFGSSNVGTLTWVFALAPTGNDGEYIFCDERGYPVTLKEEEVLIRGNLNMDMYKDSMKDIILKLRKKKEEDRLRKVEQILYFPKGDLMNNQYVVLLSQAEDVTPEDGSFVVGTAYPVFNGCLLDEDDACIFDRIRSVDEINTWDKGIRVWKLFEKTTPMEAAEAAGLL